MNWEYVMTELDECVKESTGRGCHCHPSIYEK